MVQVAEDQLRGHAAIGKRPPDRLLTVGVFELVAYLLEIWHLSKTGSVSGGFACCRGSV